MDRHPRRGGLRAAASKATPSAPGSASAPPAGKPKPSAPGPACGSSTPISPDEVAVYRCTPEGGFPGLVVRHGRWCCHGPGGAAGFEPVGVGTSIPLAQDAEITAVNPNVGTSGAIETLDREECVS